MKHQKPLAVRIFIRICVVFMTISLIGVYVVYMFAPNQEAGEDIQGDEINTGAIENVDLENVSGAEGVVVLPEVNPDEPENTEAPILITEDGEIDEMDQTFEVQLENGETEVVRQGDLGDAIEISK